MSLTTIIWLIAFTGLSALSLRRAAWGVGVYWLTFFAMPGQWWWGRPLLGPRWNIIGGCILLVAVLLQSMRSDDIQKKRGIVSRYVAFLLLLNSLLVHWFLADYPEISASSRDLQMKFVVLFFLIVASVRDRKDLRIVLYCLCLGAGYLGFEATVRDAGNMVAGRLEGLGPPAAHEANALASLLGTVIPIVGWFIFCGTKREKIAAILLAPLILNTIVLANSRSGFLGILAAAAVVLVLSVLFKGRMRRWAVLGLVGGGILGFMLLGDERIIRRFETTFVDSEERDSSAASRLEFWQAGLAMASDYPLGAGGNGFKRQHGYRYLAERGIDIRVRAIHNGYINDLCEWGIQGLAIRLAFFASAVVCLLSALRYGAAMDDHKTSFLGVCILAGMANFLVTSIFADLLDNEWGFWMVALALAYAGVAGRHADDNVFTESLDDDWEDDLPQEDELTAVETDDSPVYS